ncbi:hypothetical protein GOB57_24660 [Sinorhizobium meliloti]|nr:hypothetical protein [Sinorhizobium meliloti]
MKLFMLGVLAMTFLSSANAQNMPMFEGAGPTEAACSYCSSETSRQNRECARWSTHDEREGCHRDVADWGASCWRTCQQN